MVDPEHGRTVRRAVRRKPVARRSHARHDLRVVSLEFEFDGEVIHWRGPAPHHFVALPLDEAEQLAAVASMVTYGWGCIPVEVTLGGSTWETSIFPKDGGFLVPLKKCFREAEDVVLGDTVSLRVLVEGG